MASHVPFLALRPDEQFSVDVRKSSSIAPAANMDTTAQKPGPGASRLNSSLRFLGVCFLGLSLNGVLHSLTSYITGPELGAVSRPVTGNAYIVALTLWKIAELSLAWYAEYDFIDLASLTLLVNVPHYFLLNTFYGIGSVPLLISLGIDLIAVVAPFALLRGFSAVNEPTSHPTENQEVAWDKITRASITVLAAALYSLVVYGSFSTWLPRYMVVNFDGLRSVEAAHNAELLFLLIIFIPTGLAVSQFIFVPAVSSASNPGMTELKKLKKRAPPAAVPFDAVNASLKDTILWNLGLSRSGHSQRAEILAQRTAVVVVASFINAFVRVYVTIEGTELFGALGWAGVWAAASGLTGLALSLVANE